LAVYAQIVGKYANNQRNKIMGKPRIETLKKADSRSREVP